MRSLQRFSASLSRYRLPGTSRHALQAHRLSAASRSQVAHSWQVVKACLEGVFQPGHLQGVASRCAAARIFTRKISPLSTAQNFLPLRGADRMAPCGVGNVLDGEARAQKRLQKCARAESTRLVALVPKIKAR